MSTGMGGPAVSTVGHRFHLGGQNGGQEGRAVSRMSQRSDLSRTLKIQGHFFVVDLAKGDLGSQLEGLLFRSGASSIRYFVCLSCCHSNTFL